MGCGDCFVSASLLKKNIPATIIAIDPAYTTDQIAEKTKEINNADFHLFKDPQDALGLLIQPVDVVLLLDVIEHIADEISFIKDLAGKKFISDKTIFIISAPAWQSLFTTHDKFLLHYRRYNNDSLKKVVFNSSLQAIETGYFFFSLLPVRALQKLKEKLFNKPTRNKGLGNWKYGTLLTQFVKRILLLDFKLTRLLKKAGITMPGLSNYCICKKSVS
jgi:hypothetical protein